MQHDPRKLLLAALTTRARRSLSAFVRLMWHIIEPNTELQWGWEHEAICDHLQAVTEGRIKRLIINIPPRSLKSTIISVMWPAWVWLHKPWSRWLTGAYDKDLATRDAVRSRRIMMTPLYQVMLTKEQGAERFTFTSDQNVKTRYENSFSGHRTTTSPDSKGTGEGGDVVMIDDPNNIKKIFSEADRTQTNEWVSGMSTRVNPTSKIGAFVVIMQRGHEEDATGHLLGKRGWQLLCLTQRFEESHPTPSNTLLQFVDPRRIEGDLLNPNVMDEEAVELAEADLGPYRFNAQHQQRPGAAKGTIFKPDDWPTYDRIDFEFDFVFGSCDLNMKANDKQAMQELDKRKSCDVGWLLGVRGEKLYLISELRDQWDFMGKVAMVRTQRKSWTGVKEQLIEDKAAGSNVMEFLDEEIDHLVRVDPGSQSKIERAYACQGFTEIAERFVLPNSAVFPWVVDVKKELKAFPFGKFDDRVDVMTQAILYIKAHGAASLKNRLRALAKGGKLRFRI